MSKERNVPEIRFEDFERQWENKLLGSITDSFNHIRIPIDSGKRKKGIYPYYGATGVVDYVEDYIFEGEYVLLAEDGENIISRNAPISYITSGKFWVNNHAHIMKMINGSNEYLKNYLESLEYTHLNTGTAQPKLNSKVIKSIEISVPNFEEQKLIGNYFKKIERNIQMQEINLRKFKKFKRAMLQKMFPKEGETVPEVRFEGFEEKWERTTLGSIADIVGGGTPSTSNDDYWNGTIDWYSPAEIGDKNYLYGSQKRITKLGLEKSSAKLLPVGTVLFTSRAGIGKTAILAKMGATNQGFQSIIPHKKVLDSYFIYARTDELKKYGEEKGAGSTFTEVSGKQMEKMPISIPSIEEQKVIGNYFEILDSNIESKQAELDKLKQFKQAMLDKMFV